MTSFVMTGPVEVINLANDQTKPDFFIAMLRNKDYDQATFFFDSDQLAKLRDRINSILIAKDQ